MQLSFSHCSIDYFIIFLIFSLLLNKNWPISLWRQMMSSSHLAVILLSRGKNPSLLSMNHALLMFACCLQNFLTLYPHLSNHLFAYHDHTKSDPREIRNQILEWLPWGSPCIQLEYCGVLITPVALIIYSVLDLSLWCSFLW